MKPRTQLPISQCAVALFLLLYILRPSRPTSAVDAFIAPSSKLAANRLGAFALYEASNDGKKNRSEDAIAPLLDSMSRRLHRLQRLDDQNELSESRKAAPPGVKASKESHPDGKVEDIRTTQTENHQIRAGYVDDQEQLNSMSANAPAVLLQSGPGTGKSSILAARIAYLLETNKCLPEHMVILSFTNRDAAAIKQRALEILHPKNEVDEAKREKMIDALGKRIWSGTLHAFASSVIKKYGGGKLRVVSTKEMRSMVRSRVLRMIRSEGEHSQIESIHDDGRGADARLQIARFRFRHAMDDAKQNMEVLLSSLVRCIELWKEANLLPPATQYLIRIEQGSTQSGDLTMQESIRQACVNLAVKWGVPESSAILALDIYPKYQALHAAAGTTDPSDLAPLARDFLLADPNALFTLRTKLGHVILDEYQDVSVSQHSLIRLVLRGHDYGNTPATSKRKASKNNICFDVPRLFCAGDGNQSLYGWRGASPSLTLDKFLFDYPQGIIVPLGTNYRLPRDIMDAANLLLTPRNHDQEMTTFAISPAASLSMSNMLEQENGSGEEAWKKKNETRNADIQMLSNEILSESGATVIIQGLWDAREEAKFIAASIRKRSIERIRMCANAIATLEGGSIPLLFDPTDVAVVVRSSAQITLIKEKLSDTGIPFIAPESSQSKAASRRKRSQNRMQHMKPVKLITMHSCKGDEFDDVYLSGWTEGMFPHPRSVSSDRIDDERRLAYVALTRAKQRVVITHSFTEKMPHIGPHGRRKHFLSQVKPSRFLYELLPSSEVEKSREVASRVRGEMLSSAPLKRNGDYGFKYTIAGKDLPSHFSKSYRVPNGYVPEFSSDEAPADGSAKVANVACLPSSRVSQCSTREPQAVEHFALGLDPLSDINEEVIGKCTKIAKVASPQETRGEHLLSLIRHSLVEMRNLQMKGSCKLYARTFKDMLKEIFGVTRGVALVFVDKKRRDSTSVDELFNADDDEVTTKPLSKCTAKELAHFLAYLIVSGTKPPTKKD